MASLMKTQFRPAVADRLRRHARLVRLADASLAPEERLRRAKAFLALERARQIRLHRAGEDGLAVCRERALMADVILECLWGLAAATIGGVGPGEATLVAMGGYGRGELSPHSDIDLLILYSARLGEERAQRLREAFTQGILYPLWDMGFKVGHASRTITETVEEARANIHSKIALLETRRVCGEPALMADLALALAAEVRTPGFVRDTVRHLLDEQERRREKNGDSVFVQEPELKNGVGGLRDFHTLVWLARLRLEAPDLRAFARGGWISDADVDRLESCRSFILRVRNELHYGATRPTDLLTLEKQPEIALNLGYAEPDWLARVERFMRDYYAAAEFIRRIVLETEWRLARPSAGKSFSLASPRTAPKRTAVSTEAFVIENGLIEARDPGVFDEDPVRLLRVFHHAQRQGASLTPSLARLIREKAPLLTPDHADSPAAHKAFRAILHEAGRVYPALNAMRDLGVLTRYLPEFAPCVGLVQHELYHRYTVDIHTLLCIRELDTLFEDDSSASGVYREAIFAADDNALLYLTLLLHDIGKARGIRGHAETGAKIAAPFLARLGLRADRRALVESLIRAHLDMGAFWQRHDVDDPAMVARFADRLPGPEMLHHLFVLTHCDARGTSPNLWTSYADTLHTRLYRNALSRLRGQAVEEDPAPRRAALLSESDALGYDEELSRDDLVAHLGLVPARYLSISRAETARLHARLVNRLIHAITADTGVEALMPVLDWEEDMASGMAGVTLVSWDRPGLFYRVCGAFALAGISIHAMRAHSRSDGIALDFFRVTEPDGSPPKKSRRDRFLKHLRSVMVDGVDPAGQLAEQSARAARSRTPLRRPRPAQVEVSPAPEPNRMVVAVRAADRLGLLHDLGRIFFNHHRDIVFARIATESGYARDTFYLVPFENCPEPSPSDNERLREAILSRITE